jgi:hypothetical protein
MASRETVAEAALQFLEVVAKAAEAELGRQPERIQRSEWMVHTSPSGMSSKLFERKVFNSLAVSMMYQISLMRNDFPQQKRLTELLITAGIPREEIPYGFILPLLHHWLDLPDPFAFEKRPISRVLEEFCDAVIDKSILTSSRDAILPLELACSSVSLKEGVSIRPVYESELWELGDVGKFLPSLPFSGMLGNMPSEDWKILDIQMQHTLERVHPPRVIEIIRGAALTSLSLVSPGHLQIFDLGRKANYGMGSVGIVRGGGPTPREIGRWGGRYTIDNEVAQRLKDAWHGISRIMTSDRHHLRIPAQRLVDGGSRYREDDAIIDYAIGLEALLMKGISTELSYRFALRGATVLTWNGGDRGESFNQLRDFYDVRSNIVHGSHLDASKLRNARSSGERALRDIWWWFFNSKESLSEGMSKVDQRILE